MPGDLDKVFFTLGGAEANENAIRIAKATTGRQKILARYRSYHGATYATITLTGDPRRWANEPGMPGVVHVLDPYHGTQRGTDDAQTALAYLEETIMLEGPETIAAFILEPVTGTNGILIPPDGYLQGVRELCDRHGILLIADEVMSGFGRTGEWFAVNHWGVVPDIMTMAKGLTSSAVPLGAVGLSPKVYRYFDEHVFYGGLTYNSHPLGLAAALATIRVYEEDGLIEHSAKMGEVMARIIRSWPTSILRSGWSATSACSGSSSSSATRDDGADGAVQRRERRDEGGRQAPGRTRPVHDGPVERDHDEPAAADHRGAARGGVRDHRRGARDRGSRRRLAA
jgi:taurine--2-oxoglutarate transaminase